MSVCLCQLLTSLIRAFAISSRTVLNKAKTLTSLQWCACALEYLIGFLKTKSTITPDVSLFHEVQYILREHFNHSINRANQFYITDMQIIKAENRRKPQDQSYKQRIFTNPVKILRFLNRSIWCDRCCVINLCRQFVTSQGNSSYNFYIFR